MVRAWCNHPNMMKYWSAGIWIADLSNETFKSGELVEGYGHLGHVVGHVRGATQCIGSNRVGERLLQSLQSLTKSILCLLGRLLQTTNAQDLLLRQWLYVAHDNLHPFIHKWSNSIQIMIIWFKGEQPSKLTLDSSELNISN